MIAVLLGVLVVTAAVAAGALADSVLPAPSISVSPANPTNQTAASFTYTDSQTITKFQCQLDGAGFSDCGTTRPSTKVYAGPLAQGSHTFQVRAVAGPKTSSAASYVWKVDLTAPSVSSIKRVGVSPTNASSVQWTVKFSEDVTGVDSSDFSLVRTGTLAGGSVTGVVGSGSSYTVTASTGTGSGDLRLDLVDNDSITDAATNPLGGPGAGNGSFTAGQVYAIDRVAPTVLSITRLNASPTAAASVRWSVVFSESVSGIDSSDFSLSQSGSLAGSSLTGVTGGGSSYTVTASTGSGAGNLRLDLVDNDSITDAATNSLGGPGAGNGSVTGPAYAIDHIAPVVLSINRTSADPTTAATVQWTVALSKPVVGMNKADFVLVVSGVGGTPKVTALSGSGASYTVTASTGTGTGTLGLNFVDDDSVKDAVGNPVGGTGSGNGNFTGQVYSVRPVASGVPYTISGNASSLLYPGGAAQPINIAFNSPNAGTGTNGTRVSNLTVAITSISGPNITGPRPCDATDFVLVQFTGTYPLYVPFGASTLSSLGFASTAWPSIRLINKPAFNQDGCKNVTINLSYTGTP